MARPPSVDKKKGIVIEVEAMGPSNVIVVKSFLKEK